MRVVNLQTNEVHDVWKYLKSSDGQESVWCFDWYGHHVIGVDCEFEQTIAGNLSFYEIENLVQLIHADDWSYGNSKKHCEELVEKTRNKIGYNKDDVKKHLK